MNLDLLILFAQAWCVIGLSACVLSLFMYSWSPEDSQLDRRYRWTVSLGLIVMWPVLIYYCIKYISEKKK